MKFLKNIFKKKQKSVELENPILTDKKLNETDAKEVIASVYINNVINNNIGF
jgi:hypothetical protein